MAAAPLQEAVAVPDPVMLAGLIAPQVRPVGGLSVRLTVPVNPFTAVTVTVDIAETPTSAAEGELAEMVKSSKVNVAVAPCGNVPTAPLIGSM